MEQIIKDLLLHSHAVLLSVDRRNLNFWRGYYGRERVVELPHTELIPHVQAAIIGLTEGTLNLQNVEDFLIKQSELKEGDANQVLRAIQHIPIGAQMALPNFKRIPMKGARFAEKTDLWPIPDDQVEVETVEEDTGKMWD
jgi:hypothetical protein